MLPVIYTGYQDELLLIIEKQIRGRKMAEAGDVSPGKGLVETLKQGIELWRKKVEMERRVG